MSAYTSLQLAAAATTRPAYPVTEMLDAFKEVCFTRSAYSDVDQQYAAWRQAAEQAGWTEISRPRPSNDAAEQRDFREFYQFKAIDYALTSASLLGSYEGPEPASAIFKKQVATRTAYISMMASDGSEFQVSECRFHDQLEYWMKAPPVSKEVLQAWSGAKVRRRGSAYGGNLYVWDDANKVDRSIRVHFGYYQNPIPHWGGNFRPYAINGLMLVVTNYYGPIIPT